MTDRIVYCASGCTTNRHLPDCVNPCDGAHFRAAVSTVPNCPDGCLQAHTHTRATRPKRPPCPKQGESDVCHGCEPRQADTGRLCRNCYLNAGTALTDLPQQWDELEQWLTPGATGGTTRVSGTAEDRLPLNPVVAQHRASMETIASWWCWVLADARGLHGPTEHTLDGNAAWLHTHLQWIASQPAVACAPSAIPIDPDTGRPLHVLHPDRPRFFLPEILWASRRAGNLANPTGRKKQKVEDCPRCPGTLYSDIDPTNDDGDYSGEIICDRNPTHLWRYSQAHSLQREIARKTRTVEAA